jgi:thiamine biosynthesis protein ThiI
VLIQVRYDEIALKGGRRGWFEDRLRDNLARQLRVPGKQVKRTWGRILVDLPDADDPRGPLDAIGRTFGVASAGLVTMVDTAGGLEAIEPVACELARAAVAEGKRTFKVETRRSFKEFPLSSYEVSAELGGRVLDAVPELTVDVHDPELVIHVEVRHEGIAVLGDTEPGPGGMPSGSGGRALNLLSGGIDSPVAAWHMLKRGLHCDHVYFHAFPYTGDKVLEKVLTIARALGRWTPNVLRVFVPSTTKIQDHIAAGAPESLRIVLLRRSMYRLADAIRAARGMAALVTGEAVGQVASQTPANLLAVEAVVPETLVLRPLVGFDKREIITRAEAIGTYETSILPFQDCCSLFAPRAPETKASLKACLKAEAKLDLAPLERESLAGLEVYKIDRGEPARKCDEGLLKAPKKS